ncbi:MAG: hypothetical protein AB8G11_16845 [Saprospiraceae bacterium]
MARLIERTVQEAAQKYLEKYYKGKAKKGRMFSKVEVRTRKEYGGFRADGFLAFKKRWTGELYVVSMEAKSYKTLKAIQPYRDDKLLRKNSLWAGFLFSVGTGGLFALNGFENTISGLLFFFGMWGLGATLYGFITRNSYQHKNIAVLDQVEQYPANEKWISISEDSFEDIDKKGQDAFLKVCKSRGYGLIMVDSKRKNHRYYRPKKIYRPWGSFVKYYSLEDDIRKYLDK